MISGPTVWGALQVVKMGGVLGTVVAAPKTTSKSARLVVDVKGFQVEVKLSEVVWAPQQQHTPQRSTQQANQRNKGSTKQRRSTAALRGVRGRSQPQQGMFTVL